ncbi:hypothetical protein [Sphingomonas adhaesiva]|uniref:hypothetical protein n=1 Tax=Sphingomonas adhaesiva TaxID=28212 RepID=UPI002FF710DC
MIPSRAVLAASTDRSHEVARAWQSGTEVTRIADAFAGCDPERVDAVADVAEALLRDGRWIAPMLAPLIEALAADPWFEPPVRVTRDPLRTTALLLELPALTLTATILSAAEMARAPAPATLAASGRLSVARYHRAGGATLARWEVGPADERFSAADAPPLMPLPLLPLVDGMVCRIDGRRHAHLIEGATSDVALLTFATRSTGLTREYDRADGTLLRAATSDDAASRTRLLLTLLRVDGRRDAAAHFAAAAQDAAFHLRWDAMREWLALDLRTAAPRLRQMAMHDPHDEVRAAAARTLPLVEARLCRA